ncbi:hypothetical protein diail_5918 [Diaporthe ilicicola]|nr:hypothetical protein diail_5918 [Diaporthe ilicicola]
MNYTRKRALLACDFCRHRKRRCDGNHPCSTCLEANADCVYKELPVDRVEPSSSSQGVVAERLSRIEALLEEQGQRLNDMAQAEHYAYNSTPASFPSFRSSPQIPAASPLSVSNRSLEGADVSFESAQFLIPPGHTATSIWLLSLPAIQSVIGDFHRAYFHELEEGTPLPCPLDLVNPQPIDWPSFAPELLQELADAYFRDVSPHLPLFSRRYYDILQNDFSENGPTEDIETAICLCIWALGSIASHSTEAAISEHNTDPTQDLGVRFFQPALRIILSRSLWGFTPNLRTCQALFLSGTFFSYLGRPLHSWKMIYTAGLSMAANTDFTRTTQLLNESEQFHDEHLRMFWCCFTVECDRAATLDVVRSGIEPLGDTMPLPRSVEVSDHDDLIYFVAETALQRLINRVHSSLYSPDNFDITVLPETVPAANNPNLNRLLAISSELDRQLEQYYGSIPITPPITSDPISNDRRRILNLRYHHARHIIYRLFVLYVASYNRPQPSPIPQRSSSRSPSTQLVSMSPMPRIILEKCKICIQSCEAFLLGAVEILDKRSPYLWSISDGVLACFAVLFMASQSPYLGHLTPDLQGLADAVIGKLKKWATPGSVFEAQVRIVDRLLSR